MTTYTFDEVRAASLSWFDGDDLASSVWVTKYALQDNDLKYLEKTPSDMFKRLATEFARIEANYPNPMSYEEIYGLLSGFDVVTGKECFGDVIPQGSPMSGVGNKYKLQSLSNCFVIPSAYDSYSGILHADEEQVSIMKRRGGVGHDISTIRPRGERTANAAGTTDGIGVFMERFSNSCREVAQGGRRGALMLSIDVQHPDIETFIEIKRDRTKVTGANISIRLNDEFMEAVVNKSDFILRWPTNVPVTEAKVVRVIHAPTLWDKIISAAHDNAEPGLLFWDNILRNGPADIYPEFRSVSTNPCGEIPLSPYDSCRLLLLNLNRFVINPFTSTARFDHKRFEVIAAKAQRLMDDLVDLEIECVDKIIQKIKDDPEPEHVKRTELDLWQNIRNAGSRGRRTGLGITGLGDAIASCGIRYGANESVEWVENAYSSLAVASYRSSVQMAKERGAFPAFDCEIENGHALIQKVLKKAGGNLLADYEQYGRRNIANTTTAPAGSTSLVTQTTSGCEPLFRIDYTRRKKVNPNDLTAQVDYTDDLGDKWTHFKVYHYGVSQWMKITGETDTTKSPYYGATSDDVDWSRRVDLQAAAQSWICHSISSTINLPKETSVDTVKEIYLRGWKSGCKGLTIYRDGCRDGVMITEEKPTEEQATIVDTNAPKRPKILPVDIHHAQIRGEKYVVLVGLLNGRPYEVFAGLSKFVEVPKKLKSGFMVKNGKNEEGVSTYNLQLPAGDDDFFVIKDVVEQFDNQNYGAFSRIISTALRHGTPVNFLCDQLRKDKHSDITSFAAVIARVLSKHYVVDSLVVGKKCESCGSTNLKREQSCLTCVDCGSSKCG